MFYTPNGELVIDFGQNLTGYVEFDIVAKDSAGDLVFNEGDATWSINGKR